MNSTIAPAQTLHLLCQWEANGYDDSDFYAAYWDNQNKNVITDMIGTTRFAGGASRVDPADFKQWDFTALDNFRNHFENYIFNQLRAAEDRDVLEPSQVEIGTAVKLLETHNSRKLYSSLPCPKCNGTGHWVNPKNSDDKRTCFNCNGLKVVPGKEPVKGYSIAPGTLATVLWTGTFRTIHRSGYNQLDRGTLSTRLLLEDGLIANVPLSKLRLAKEPESNEYLRQVAHDLSFNFQIESLVGCRAWLSSTHIPKALIGQLKSLY